jgi:hypothetical protein
MAPSRRSYEIILLTAPRKVTGGKVAEAEWYLARKGDPGIGVGAGAQANVLGQLLRLPVESHTSGLVVDQLPFTAAFLPDVHHTGRYRIRSSRLLVYAPI